VRWRIDARDAMRGYLWAWSENQVLAAVKLVPLGQSAGQRLLHRLTATMPALVERALTLGMMPPSASVRCRRRSPAPCMNRSTAACSAPDRHAARGSATFGSPLEALRSREIAGCI
jgi:hypothetical protein